MKWIKTSEQLPAVKKWVLVSNKDGDTEMASLEEVGKELRGAFPNENIPEKLMWEHFLSSCCNEYFHELHEFPYWAELPKVTKE